jgi:hypothetical protein
MEVIPNNIFVAFSLAQKLYSSRVSPLSTEFTIMVTQNEITNAYIKRSLPLNAMGHYQNGVFPSLLFSSYNGFFQDVNQFLFFIILNILFTASFSLIVLFFGYRPSAYFKANNNNSIIGSLAGRTGTRDFHTSPRRQPIEVGLDGTFREVDPGSESIKSLDKSVKSLDKSVKSLERSVKKGPPPRAAVAGIFGKIIWSCATGVCAYGVLNYNLVVSGDAAGTANANNSVRTATQKLTTPGVGHKARHFLLQCVSKIRRFPLLFGKVNVI